MRIVDTNVLVYAADRLADRHRESRGWLKAALSGREPVAIPESVAVGFLRIATHPRVLSEPLTIAVAHGLLTNWQHAPAGIQIESAAGHLDRIRALLEPLGKAGDLVPDAHLAALALENDATIVSYDADFGRFAGVRWERPAA